MYYEIETPPNQLMYEKALFDMKIGESFSTYDDWYLRVPGGRVLHLNYDTEEGQGPAVFIPLPTNIEHT